MLWDLMSFKMDLTLFTVETDVIHGGTWCHLQWDLTNYTTGLDVN